MKYLKFFILTIPVFFFSNKGNAQELQQIPGVYDVPTGRALPDTSLKLKITSIEITGNKRTKTYIILREVPFKNGDSLVIAFLPQIIEQARRQIYNINLFSEVTVTPVWISANELSVHILLREKWYIYPTPQFQLVDRNFNDWVKTFNADFNRVVYGLKFVHYNFSGRSDQLRIYALNGYSRNFSFSYSAPYSNSKLNEGFRIYAGYQQNREIAYKTSENNTLVFFRRDNFVRSILYAGISYQRRKGYFNRHNYAFSYSHLNINDSILDTRYNPKYFNIARTQIGIPDFSYSFSHSNTNNINYPLTGKNYGFTVLKRGLGIRDGINMFSLSGYFSKFISHNKNWYSTLQTSAKLVLPFTQPYINLRALGYGDFYLRGMEYYVIDGVATAVAKYTLKKKLLAFDIPIPFKIKAVPKIPFKIFAKTYADGGYSYINKQFDTRLNNRFLYSGGIGLDILSLYDVYFSLEYSYNQLGQKGLFLHAKGGF